VIIVVTFNRLWAAGCY